MSHFSDFVGAAPDTILGMSDEEAIGFVRARVASKTLHQTIEVLNKDVLSGDPARQDRATRALHKLGFV